MDQDDYKPNKRRRTSSIDSSSSRRSISRQPPRHAKPGPSKSDGLRRRSYSPSSSRDDSRGPSPQRRRSESRNRTSRSPSGNSAYDSAPEHHDRRASQSPSPSSSRSRSRSHSNSRSRSRSRSYSPIEKEDNEKKSRPTPPPSKSLTFTSLSTLTRAHDRGITCVKFSPDMTLLATGSADNAIKIYSVPQNPTTSTPFKLLRTLRAHLAGINAIAWSPVGPPYTLASGSDDKTILLWSPLSSDFPISPSPLMGHSNYVYSLAFSPKGNMLVSGSFDEAVFLWDVRSGRVMRSLPAHSDPVGGVDFLHDGSMVCSCAADGLIRIWDSGTGQCLRTLVDEDRKAVTNVRFSPNGKFILAWTLDSSIRLWRYIEGTCVKTYQGHTNQNFSLGGVMGSYIKDVGHGKRYDTEAFVASGSEDGDVVVWDVVTKDILWRGKGHKDVVLAMDFGRTKDGTGLLVSVGKDRDIRIWSADGEATRENGIRGEHGPNHIKSNDMDMDMDMDMPLGLDDEQAIAAGGSDLNGMDIDTPNHDA